MGQNPNEVPPGMECARPLEQRGDLGFYADFEVAYNIGLSEGSGAVILWMTLTRYARIVGRKPIQIQKFWTISWEEFKAKYPTMNAYLAYVMDEMRNQVLTELKKQEIGL